MLNKFKPTFSQSDLMRINSNGLSRKESLQWVAWEIICRLPEIIFVVCCLVCLVSWMFWALGSSAGMFISFSDLKCVGLVTAAVVSFMGLVATVSMAVDRAFAINRHTFGVISLEMVLASYNTDKTLWDVHNTSASFTDPVSHRTVQMFFPPWERAQASKEVKRLKKEACCENAAASVEIFRQIQSLPEPGNSPMEDIADNSRQKNKGAVHK